MKAEERHHLKQNEFAISVARLATSAKANRDRVMLITVAVVLIAAIGGGIMLWQNKKRDAAGADFAKAMAISDAQIAPAPTVPGATQAAGTYPTIQARQEAALKAFQQVASTYHSTNEGL